MALSYIGLSYKTIYRGDPGWPWRPAFPPSAAGPAARTGVATARIEA